MLKQIAKMRREDGSLPPPTPVAEEDAKHGLQMFSLVPDPQRPPPSGGVISGFGGQPVRGPTNSLSSLTNARGGSGVVLEGFQQTDPRTDHASRLSYATAMRQIHTGEIPGLYTYSVEEGLREEEAQRALAEAAKMDRMGERAEDRARAKVEHEYGNDEEDETERLKQVKMDDWKDTHKRGEGNRKNRS